MHQVLRYLPLSPHCHSLESTRDTHHHGKQGNPEPSSVGRIILTLQVRSEHGWGRDLHEGCAGAEGSLLCMSARKPSSLVPKGQLASGQCQSPCWHLS